MKAWLAATLPVLDLATMSVRAVVAAATRAGGRIDDAIDPQRVAAAFSSDRLFRLDGAPIDGFAALSGFFATADGFIRTHANYPHHRERLLAIVGLGPAATRADLAAALRDRSAQSVEDDAAAAGAIAARVRTEGEWRSSPAGLATASGPLVRTTVRPDALRPPAPARRAPDNSPLAGVRVLDLTRVIAGPTGTRTLGLLGAEVLRLDPPQLPEIAWQHLDTGAGKRSATLDLRTQLAAAQELLDRADVLVTGYRPGALAIAPAPATPAPVTPAPVTPHDLPGLRIPPGLIHARLSAWGFAGPWAGRRGFDSIVQAASGIALIESPDEATPGALPAQALDHATGYLLAAGIIDALTERARDGHGRDVTATLARTATWLLDAPGRDPLHAPAATAFDPAVTVTHRLADGVSATIVRPALPGFDDFPFPPHPWGSDPAQWD